MVGEKEEADGTVNVRTRDNVVHGMHSLDAVRDVLLREKATRSLTSVFAGDKEEGAPPQNGSAGSNGAAAQRAGTAAA